LLFIEDVSVSGEGADVGVGWGSCCVFRLEYVGERRSDPTRSDPTVMPQLGTNFFAITFELKGMNRQKDKSYNRNAIIIVSRCLFSAIFLPVHSFLMDAYGHHGFGRHSVGLFSVLNRIKLFSRVPLLSLLNGLE
jgi:hypothetical protein